ncbi:MAG: putative quinol monooxygenase [Bacteroidota bacterium]
MKFIRKEILYLLPILLLNSCAHKAQENLNLNADNMIIRISEIELNPEYIDEYVSILKAEAEASVRLEKGVVSIFPMFQKEKPDEIRILEIYADKGAYEAHLKTPHFQHYKTTTLKMVKGLKLIDMKAIDGETMASIFLKLKQ